MEKCCKCDNKLDGGTTITEWFEDYHFCAFCSAILENINQTGIIKSFLDPNASDDESLPMTFVQRNMLKAKERRKQGISPWIDK